MHRYWKRALLAGMGLAALALLIACTPRDKLGVPLITSEPWPTPTATPEPVDADFTACASPLAAVPAEGEEQVRIAPARELKSETGPVTQALALQNLGGVLFVGTEGTGQFLAALDLESGEVCRLYTVAPGQYVTSLVQTKKYGHFAETGAFTWTETDGDAWRLRIYDERLQQGEDEALLAETTLESGSLSSGSAFLPSQSDAGLPGDLLTFALLSEETPVLRTASHGGRSYPLQDAELLCRGGAPVWKAGDWKVAYLEERGRTDCFCFAALDEEAQAFRPVHRASYRLPRGEEVERILAFRYDGPQSWSLCFCTDAGNVYWHEQGLGTADTRWVAQNAALAAGTLYGEALCVPEGSAQVQRFCREEEALCAFSLGDGAAPTALTAAYTGDRANDPYEICVFATASGAPAYVTLTVDTGGR